MAINTATMIAGLRSRLRDQEILEHSRVKQELQGLLEQLQMQLIDPADPSPGRHRANPSPAGSYISDSSPHELKPNPLAATNAAEFISALWRYRSWSGEPSWRTMATKAKQAVVHSTMYNAMNGDTLPKLEVVRAIIIGCGGGEEDLDTFITAWHRITTGKARHPANAKS